MEEISIVQLEDLSTHILPTYLGIYTPTTPHVTIIKRDR